MQDPEAFRFQLMQRVARELARKHSTAERLMLRSLKSAGEVLPRNPGLPGFD
jgi:hypothetical protein